MRDLVQVVLRLSSCHDLAAVVAVLRAAARELTGADGVTVVLREADQCYYAEENAIGPLWKGRRFPMDACISGWSMLNRQRVAIADIREDPRVPLDAYRPTFVRSLAMVPIRSEDPIGAIGAYWSRHHAATPEELDVMQALADSASIAVANGELIAELREASRRKDQLLAALAHELRNPLGPVRNAVQLLRLKGDDAKTAARAREIIDRQVGHMARLVDDLLDVSRLAGGRIELQRERLDLGRLVRQAVGDRRGVLEARGLRIGIEVPDTPVWIHGDATRLEQVLGNLLDNAAKFTDVDGEVQVHLEESGPDGAVLTVRDDGVGLCPEMKARMFEPGAQADRSLDRSRGGLGLGLALARGIVELHGGLIAAESEGPGSGTQVTIRLKREPELPALSAEPHVVEAPVPRLRVLVVEDNEDAAETLRLLIEASGHDVNVAHNGTDGVAAARRVCPDVVVCDIGLPGMDGFAVAGSLRGHPATSAVRLIALTGYGGEEDRGRARDAGFDAHLVKPVDPRLLLEQIGSSLSAGRRGGPTQS
jgi:signal transduction histidine kinase/ActR/RegA family two-component response regulator